MSLPAQQGDRAFPRAPQSRVPHSETETSVSSIKRISVVPVRQAE